MKKLLVLLSVLVALPALAQNMYVDHGNASIVSKAGQDLKLKSGTSGKGLTIASATGNLTGGAAIVATTTVTGTTGVIATAGGVTATAGGITATAGGITATTGNITATAGAVVAGAGVKYPAAIMETKAATGANQGNSTALTAGKFIHMVTAADETTGVVLPACAAGNVGEVHYVMNTVANKFLNIWPATDGNINGLGANAVYAGGATGQGRKTHVCACQAANVWYCG